MTQAWYQVASLSFGYLSCALMAVVVLLSLRKVVADRALWRRVRRNTPQVGAAGVLRVLSGGGRKLAVGDELRLPYEGTMGSAMRNDVYMPSRKVHLRSAFFWMDKGALHMVPLHRDGFTVDGAPVNPGDEAVLHTGAILCVGELRMALTLYAHDGVRTREELDVPYVTPARRGKAQQGRGDGLGAPTRGEARREARRRGETKPQEKPRAKQKEKTRAQAAKGERTARAQKGR